MGGAIGVGRAPNCLGPIGPAEGARLAALDGTGSAPGGGEGL